MFTSQIKRPIHHRLLGLVLMSVAVACGTDSQKTGPAPVRDGKQQPNSPSQGDTTGVGNKETEQPNQGQNADASRQDGSGTANTGSVVGGGAAGGMVGASKPGIADKDDLTGYLLEVESLLRKEDKNLGYSLNAGSHTRDLFYNGQKIFSVKPSRDSHCVGATFQYLIMALNNYFKKTGDAKAWNMPNQWLKWAPFKACWYVDGKSCLGARDALVKHGLGQAVGSFAELKPGDFVNFDRTNRTGHSVMFLKYLYRNGQSGLAHTADTVGFQYSSSQGSTNGFATLNAFFSDNCDKSHAHRDCGIIKKSLVMGRVLPPSQFKKQFAPVSLTDFLGLESEDILEMADPMFTDEGAADLD